MSLSRFRPMTLVATLAASLTLCATPALAAGHGLDGAALSAWWALPFGCMLLSIAIMPLTLPELWSNHFGKITVMWALTFLAPAAVLLGAQTAWLALLHTMLLEYVPFLVLLFALFTISGGVRVRGNLGGAPVANTGLLLVGAFLSSIMGTTGSAMLLIRPLLRANAHRRYKVHTIVFFIFLVANIGGSLTPLGDPPLFLGFLKGVSFFWTTRHLLVEMLFATAVLLAVYFLIDFFLFRKEGKPISPAKLHSGHWADLRVDGGVNLFLLLGVIGAVLLSGTWNPGVDIRIAEGIELSLQDLSRDLLLLGLAGLSLLLTSKRTREDNDFTWEPIMEVGKLFFGIFITMIPAIAMLKAGEQGSFREVITLVTHDGQPVNHMYFWLSGILSSFLDNAPTYLVFFNTAGGDAHHLMFDAPRTLAAISCGSVFMGANSYIGNAPNFMIRSISESQGVKMPSFFGYMAWSVGILIPLFLVMTVVFFE